MFGSQLTDRLAYLEHVEQSAMALLQDDLDQSLEFILHQVQRTRNEEEIIAAAECIYVEACDVIVQFPLQQGFVHLPAPAMPVEISLKEIERLAEWGLQLLTTREVCALIKEIGYIAQRIVQREAQDNADRIAELFSEVSSHSTIWRPGVASISSYFDQGSSRCSIADEFSPCSSLAEVSTQPFPDQVEWFLPGRVKLVPKYFGQGISMADMPCPCKICRLVRVKLVPKYFGQGISGADMYYHGLPEGSKTLLGKCPCPRKKLRLKNHVLQKLLEI